MDYSHYECIKFEREGRILRVTLNRPEVLNAVDEQLHHELAQVFYDVSLDRECDVVILTGEGRAFCAGGDVSMMERLGVARRRGSLRRRILEAAPAHGAHQQLPFPEESAPPPGGSQITTPPLGRESLRKGETEFHEITGFVARPIGR